tara:strand:+ start:4448 stop:5380 length:933 start_codon:yes stop_codon:yes gene_type:complete
LKILDCTLRDGGFTKNFNWDFGFASRYYELMTKFKIPYIELGYWMQTSKSENPFYNFNFDHLNKIVGKSDKQNVSIIIDYHYCNKDTSKYPKKFATPVSMIRMTARKEDFNEALIFSSKLKKATNLDISIQIINSTNYSKKELEDTVKELVKHNFYYVYFADSHGNLNLISDYSNFEDSISILKENNINVGFHLHNHTNRALLNYYFCLEKKINITDTSILGLGKGGGNLQLEHVIINENLIELLNFIDQEKANFDLKDNKFLYTIISGRLNITDNYAKEAISKNISLENFYNKASELRGVERDTFKEIF